MANGTDNVDDAPVAGKSDRGANFDAISGGAAGWFGVVLTLLALAAFVGISYFLTTDSLGYAALAGTAILAIGLVALIVLSRAVGVIEPAAALGLPHGSIRALLALGLAIVFVSVASWTLGGLFNPVGPLVSHVIVQKGELKGYWDRYPASDYIVKEGSTASASAKTPSPAPTGSNAQPPAASDQKAGDQNERVELSVYLRRTGSDQAVLDLAKQILTISATVLVTIVGFYFGSNSSADAARTLNDIMTGMQGGSGSPTEPKKEPPSMPDDLVKEGNAIAAISGGSNSKLQSLGADPMKLLRDAVAGAGGDPELPSKLQAAEQLFTDMKAKTAAAAVDASRAKEATDSLPANTPQPQLRQASERLQQLRTDAEQANHDFEDKFAQFTAAKRYILEKTAKG
jgi:hypothetical protein